MTYFGQLDAQRLQQPATQIVYVAGGMQPPGAGLQFGGPQPQAWNMPQQQFPAQQPQPAEDVEKNNIHF